MTSPAEKLFDEIDSLMVRLSGLREMRKEKLESIQKLDLEIGQVRLLLQAKHAEFERVTESVAARSSPDSSSALPAPSGVADGFKLRALTPRGREKLPEIERMFARLLLPHGWSL